MAPKDWWYISFAICNIVGLGVAAIYELFLKPSPQCRPLTTWLICHGVICIVYHIFMRHFYNAFISEAKQLETDYVTLNHHVRNLMENLGYGLDQGGGIYSEDSLHCVTHNESSTKIHSLEMGAFTFITTYVVSLSVGLILFSQNKGCVPWLSYGTLALILGSILSVIFHGCLKCHTSK